MNGIIDRLIVLWGWRRALVSYVLGCVTVLGFAPFDLSPILWITFPCLIWILDGASDAHGSFWTRFKPAFAVGWWFGFGFFTVGLHWMGSAFFVNPGRDALLLPFALFGLPAVLAVFWGTATGLARFIWPDGWPRILSFTLFFFMAEWLRGHILTGFPWNLIGYAIAPSPVFMQSASIIGVYGLTLLAILVFSAPAAYSGNSSPSRRNTLFLCSVIGLLFAHGLFGLYRTTATEIGDVDGVSLRIVQPAIQQTEKWKPENRKEILETYLRLSAEDQSRDGGLLSKTHLIWPEVALPYLLTESPEALSAIADLLPPETRLLTGAIRAQPSNDGDRRIYFNSLYLIDDDGTLLDSNDKVHLVPFGEYLPFRTVLEAIGLTPIVQSAGRFEAGRGQRLLDPIGAPGVGTLICYEAIFPSLSTGWSERPGWLLNVTNDAWFGKTIGPEQHFRQARLRAVETGLPVIRAANTGISAIVDPLGQIRKFLPIGEQGILDSGLPTALKATFYSNYGGIFLLICVVFIALVLGYQSFREKQSD